MVPSAGSVLGGGGGGEHSQLQLCPEWAEIVMSNHVVMLTTCSNFYHSTVILTKV